MAKRRTILPDPRVFPRFAGISTFCRYPQICHVAPENAPVDWAIYGVPYDGAVTYRPGARFGPRAIREESQYVKAHHLEHDVTLTDVLSVADAGDSPIAPYSCEQTQAMVCAFAMELGDAKRTKLLAVGGDHSIALGNIRATAQRRAPKGKRGAKGADASGGLALLHFDSHLDTMDVIWGEKHTHGSVFRRAIEEGLIDPKRMLSVGIKGPLNRRDDLEFAQDHGVTVVSCEQWRNDGGKKAAAFLKRLGDDEAYLSFDIDVVDPAFAPGTGTPSVGGLSSAEALGLMRSLAGANIVGADVVEVLPDRDPAGITALLAAHIMFEILCLDAVRRRGAAGA